MVRSLEDKFNLYCKSNNLEVNKHQIILIKKLQEYYKENFKSSLFNFFSKKSYKKAFYLYGDIGVGKTMILDFFFILFIFKFKIMKTYHKFIKMNSLFR